MAIFRPGPPTGALNATGYKKNRNFRPIFRYISKTIQDTAVMAIVTMHCESVSCRAISAKVGHITDLVPLQMLCVKLGCDSMP